MINIFLVPLRNYSKCFKRNLNTSSRTKSSSLVVGDRASLVKSFTQNDVNLFAELTEDRNIIHSKTSELFPKPIVHGVLVGGLVSAVVGTKLPGPGSVLVSQTIRFHSPVFVGNEVTADVVVTDIKKKFLYLSFECSNTSNNETVISGNMVVLFTKQVDSASSS